MEFFHGWFVGFIGGAFIAACVVFVVLDDDAPVKAQKPPVCERAVTP